jgi:hypothetical protein
MELFKIGDRVSLLKEARSLSYVSGRHFYTDVHEGKMGTIIGFTGGHTYSPISNKVAIQFDTPIFTRPEGRISSHDTGCHGKGKNRFSWYFPANCIKREIDADTLLLL